MAIRKAHINTHPMGPLWVLAWPYLTNKEQRIHKKEYIKKNEEYVSDLLKQDRTYNSSFY
jgi:hypothetical protein